MKHQMYNGFGGALAFDIYTHDLQQTGRFVKSLQNSQLVAFAESLASPETILAHPAAMSHRSLTQARRDELGIGNNFFRLSLGFEDAHDIIHVLNEALRELDVPEPIKLAKSVAATAMA